MKLKYLFSFVLTIESSSASQSGAANIHEAYSHRNEDVNMVYVADVDCPLKCEANAPCIRGAPDYVPNLGESSLSLPFLSNTQNADYHCDCPPGRTGILCEREYETCSDGEHYCFHGGRCIPSLHDTSGQQLQYCDCSDAAFEGDRYAGRYCELQSSDVCERSVYGKTTDFFCVNGGSCKVDYKAHIDQPCLCDNDHEGPHCEYNSGENPACTMQCFNGGACHIGAKDYDRFTYYNDFWMTHQDNMHCKCPEGFFGLQCEIEGKPCGDNHCFNGGTCVTKQLSDGTIRDYCDCSTADTGEKSYAGRFCEAESTSFCSKIPDHNGHQFCVNGGTCKAESHLGCDCLEGFNGPICEFHDSHKVETPCTLQCKHNGVCRNGAKDLSLLQNFGMTEYYDESYSNNFEHCVCPRGYVGLQCEHRVEVCPGGQHVCMNGGGCVPKHEDNQLVFECDCGIARSPLYKFAGDYCEVQSSEICTVTGRPGRGKSTDAFCANGGVCVDYVGEDQEHPGCICSIGFEGIHCETGRSDGTRRPTPPLPGHEQNEEGAIEGKKFKLGIGQIIFIVIGVDAFIIVVFATIFFLRRKQRKESEQFGATHEPYTNYSTRGILPPPTLENIRSMSSPYSRDLYTDEDDYDEQESKREETSDLVNIEIF